MPVEVSVAKVELKVRVQVVVVVSLLEFQQRLVLERENLVDLQEE